MSLHRQSTIPFSRPRQKNISHQSNLMICELAFTSVSIAICNLSAYKLTLVMCIIKATFLLTYFRTYLFNELFSRLVQWLTLEGLGGPRE